MIAHGTTVRSFSLLTHYTGLTLFSALQNHGITAHCWIMVNLSSTSTSRSLAAELLSSRSAL